MLRSWPLAAQRAFFEEDLGIPLALEEETENELKELIAAHAKVRDPEQLASDDLTLADAFGDG